MIWFTSDFHFGHNRSFIYEARGFQSIRDMDEAIVENFKNMVADDDDLYILGDLIVGDTEQGLEYLKQIPGRLHIILGNHDTDTRVALFRTLPNIQEVVYAQMVKYGKKHFFLCHYPALITSHGCQALHGHTHQPQNFMTGPDGQINYNLYHVGVDSHGCKPISAEEIIRDMQAIRPEKAQKNRPSGERQEERRKQKEEQQKLSALAEQLVSREDVLERIEAATADGRLSRLTQLEDMAAVVKLMPELLCDLYADAPALGKAVCRLGNQYVRDMLMKKM